MLKQIFTLASVVCFVYLGHHDINNICVPAVWHHNCEFADLFCWCLAVSRGSDKEMAT